MATYPGIRRATVSYVSDSIAAIGGLLVVMGVCCLPALSFFFGVGGAPASYALFAYLGLCIYLGQRDLDNELRTVVDVSDSRLVAGMLGALTILYYNAVVILATVLGTALSSGGGGDWALAVSLLYPFYDAEMAQRSIPLSLAGVLVSGLVLFAWIAETLAALFGVDTDDETIDRVRRLGSTSSILQDYLLDVYDRSRNRGTSH